MNVGDEWIYRKQECSESERVVIRSVSNDKRKRIDVEFVDGDKAGLVESTPQGRLKAPWSTVAEYDWLQERWKSIDAESLSLDESIMLDTVFELVIPPEVATKDWSPIRDSVTIHDVARVEEVFGSSLEQITSKVASFAHGPVVHLAPASGYVLAKLATAKNPLPVLAWVMEDEARCRHESKKGRTHQSLFDKGEEIEVSPQYCHEEYLRETRYLHEELRGWCGQEPITLLERSLVAEMEAQRLTLLVVDLIDSVRGLDRPAWADNYEERLRDDVVTRADVRPLVERPLSVFDLPDSTELKQNKYWRRSYWG
jgi:hypothetical protein